MTIPRNIQAELEKRDELILALELLVVDQACRLLAAEAVLRELVPPGEAPAPEKIEAHIANAPPNASGNASKAKASRDSPTARSVSLPTWSGVSVRRPHRARPGQLPRACERDIGYLCGCDSQRAEVFGFDVLEVCFARCNRAIIEASDAVALMMLTVPVVAVLVAAIRREGELVGAGDRAAGGKPHGHTQHHGGQCRARSPWRHRCPSVRRRSRRGRSPPRG